MKYTNLMLKSDSPINSLSISSSPLINKQKVASAFSRAAHSYEQHNELQQRSGNALLRWLPEQAEWGLDLGCGSGWFAPALKQKTKQLLALDLSPAMLQQAQRKAKIVPICADMDTQPLAEHSLDWIFANLCLQWSSDPAAWLVGWSQRLKPGGVLVFATLIDASLHELAHCWQSQGQPSPVNHFITQQRLEQYLAATGRRWQCQTATEQLTYPNLKALLLDLKGIGANRVNNAGRAGLMGKHTWQQLNLTYPVNKQGRCVATYQLAYGVIYG
ncbi:malonyl-ACP O-methyltransferase BioC [Oceanisphaera ostreae]|uniref:Malonyl-[acyl-carrier protein] O-methyltransferase n=1 Tax=Oceanisphaera ostreae TaxID=914151 RepID=A0ABW3KMB6_9GAMM